MIVLIWIRRIFSTFTIRDYFFLGVIIVLLVVLLFKGYHKKDNNTITVLPVLRPTTQKVDNNGTKYTEIKGTIYTQTQMKSITDSLQRVLGKGKVTQVTRTVTKVDTYYTTKNVYIDTIKGTIVARDSNRDMQQSFTGNYRTNNYQFRLQLTPDTATEVSTIKSHWFKASDYKVSTYHTNSLFTSSEGYSYTAKIPKIIGTIGPTIGAAYCTDGKLHGFAGIGFTLNIIGLKNNR